MSSDILRRAFNDICRGYTEALVSDEKIYIKHLCHSDQLDLDLVEKNFFNLAKTSGLPAEDERIAQLKNEGRWTDENERELGQIKLSVQSLIDGRKNATLPSILKRVDSQIEEEHKLYNKKYKERAELVGLTCELYSHRRVNEHYIFQNLYRDRDFKEHFFSQEGFDDLSEVEMARIIEVYNSVMEPCSDLNIKKLAIQDFFQSYYYISGDNFMNFYGKAICQLSLFQVKLANFAKYFRSIFENHDMKNVPKNILEDPDKLVDWVMATDRVKQQIEKQKDSDMGGVVGMTKEDRKAAGMQTPQGPDALMQALTKKGGGSLDKTEIMRAMGKMN